MRLKYNLILAAVLVLLIMPAVYANVMETSLAVRDRLSAENRADLPGFIARMEAMDSKVSFDSTGYYAVYNENDLRGIFGEDAVILSSPPGLLTISYKRGGVYKFWGMLHGLVVADSARKAITITKGGFISSENASVNIAGEEIVIDARNPSRASFKISRDGVYVQNNYFVGCEPEQEATAEDCLYEKCEKGLYGYEESEYSEEEDCHECTFEEMKEYEENVERENYCELRADVAPQYAYANATGVALLSESAFLKEYKMQTPKDFSETIIDAEGFLRYIGDLRNMQIEKGRDISFTASAPAGGDINFRGLKSSELFRYSMKGDYNYLSGDRLEIYANGLPWDVVEKAEDVGNSPHTESIVKIFDGNMGDRDTPWVIEIKKGSLYFSDETFCPIETGAFCFFKETNFDEYGGISYYYQLPMLPQREKPLVVDINAETLSLYRYSLEKKDVLVDIGPFSNADTSSKVRLVNNAGTAVEFTSSDITINPPDKSWTDLGVSFKGYMPPEEGIPSVEMDILECRYNEGKCYLNGAEALGFIGGRAQRNRLCLNDEICGEDSKCIEGLCVKKATCGIVGERDVGINGISGQATFVSDFARQKADVIFISDDYGSKQQFDSDIQSIINTAESSNGIFSVEPFKSNIQKFSFHYAFGGSAPSVSRPEGIMVPWERYVNGIVKQCASAEYAIVLTQKNFRAFAEPWRTGIAEKGTAWVSVGAQRENFPETALHEFGHAFGGLRDEYYEQRAGTYGYAGVPNCLSKTEALDKWKEWPDVLADAEQEKWKECGGPCDSSCASLLRPSENSIMNNEYIWMEKRNEPGWKAFNPPSETHLIERLNEYS